MKTTYYFELTKSCVPKVKGGKLIEDSNVGGIKNSYKIYKVFYITLSTRYDIKLILRKVLLGNKAFLKPFKKEWKKLRMKRLPKVYWGTKKSLFIEMWCVLLNDYNTLSEKSVILYETDTQSELVKVFNISFKSTQLKTFLKSNKCFTINQITS